MRLFPSFITHLPGVSKITKHFEDQPFKDMSQDDQQRYLAFMKAMQSDPEVMAAVRTGKESEIEAVLHRKFPNDFDHWRIREDSNSPTGFAPTQRMSNKRAVAYTAAGFAPAAYAYLGPGFGAGAATSGGSSAGGIGVGETAATTGLSGPIAGMSVVNPITGAATLPSVATAGTAGTLPAGLQSGSAAKSAGLTGAGIKGAGGGMGSSIGSLLKNPGFYSGVADVFGSGAKTSADNRKDEFNARYSLDNVRRQAQNDYDTLRLNAQNNYDRFRQQAQEDYDTNQFRAAENRRTDESDAWKKLQQSEYMLHNAHAYQPPVTRSGVQLGSYGFGPKEPTERERAGASTISDQMMQRLQPGGSYQPMPLFQPTGMFQPTPMFQPDDKLEGLMNPGKGEKIQDWVSRIANIFGSVSPYIFD